MMKHLVFISITLVVLLSLNGCLFFGGSQLRVLGGLTHPTNEFKYANDDPPSWVQTGTWQNSQLVYGIGSAYNLDRFYAIEDARTVALANLAESLRAEIEMRVTQTRSTEGTLGASRSDIQRIVEEHVKEVIRNAEVQDSYVFHEQVWGPKSKTIWRTKAYVLVTSDVTLYDLVATEAE